MKIARIVDQHIDPAESGYGCIRDLSGCFCIADVSIDQCKIRRRGERVCFRYVSRVRNNVITPFQKCFHQFRANPL
jgi:hypothetical protein